MDTTSMEYLDIVYWIPTLLSRQGTNDCINFYQ